MKRLIMLLLCAVLLVLPGCGKKAEGHEFGMIGGRSWRRLSQDVQITLAGTNQTGTLDIWRVVNHTDKDYHTDLGFELEILLDGKWHTTNYDLVDLPSGSCFCPAGEAEYNAFDQVGGLPGGTYRFIKKFYPDELHQNRGKVYAGLEFEMDEALEPMQAVTFRSLEEMEAAANSEPSLDDPADMTELRSYWLPTGLPEGYELYKITATAADTAFWYLPAEVVASGNTEEAERADRHFVFICQRIGAAFGMRSVEPGRGLVPEDPERLLVLRIYGETMYLRLPEGVSVREEDVDAVLYKKQGLYSTEFRKTDIG